MLFKEKLLLSNCDSVRALDGNELRKRFLTGLAFADGVVLSPNALIDNAGIAAVISQSNVTKYLNEEGQGKLVIRGFGMDGYTDVRDYYHALPDSFILSSLPGAPCKGQLDRYSQRQMLDRLAELQGALSVVRPTLQGLSLEQDSLRREVLARLTAAGSAQQYFENDGDHQLFLLGTSQLISRSQWYTYAQNFFGARGLGTFPQMRAEIIDPAYNSLFAVTNEGFLQDDIRYLTGIPEVILDAGVAIKSLRREIELIQYPLKVFEIISSLGAGELVRYLTDEAIGYIEDKMVDSGKSWMTRKNWFGMYPRMRRFMGLEIK